MVANILWEGGPGVPPAGDPRVTVSGPPRKKLLQPSQIIRRLGGGG